MSVIKKEFDENYFENFLYKEKKNSQRNNLRKNTLLSYISTGKLLEVGCGGGNLLYLLKDAFSVEGIEISDYGVDQANALLHDKVRKSNIENATLASNTYNVVLAFNLLEHLPNPLKTIKNVHGSLREDGVFFGSMPNNFGVIGGAATLFSNIVDKTHCSTFSPRVWESYFKDAGFREVIFFGEVMIGRNRSFYVQHALWKYVSFNLMFICRK